MQKIAPEEPLLKPAKYRWMPKETIAAPVLRRDVATEPIERRYALLIAGRVGTRGTPESISDCFPCIYLAAASRRLAGSAALSCDVVSVQAVEPIYTRVVQTRLGACRVVPAGRVDGFRRGFVG